MNMRKIATTLGLFGLALGLLDAGVGASFTDSATAVLNINVGTFECRISSTTPGAVVSNHGHSVTYDAPDIASSAAGSSYFSFAIQNTGSIPVLVHWGITASAGVVTSGPYNPGVQDFAATAGSIGNWITTDITLAPGASHNYDNMGLQWIALTNVDLNASQWVEYTANCGEVPPPPASKISYVGEASAAGTTVTLPSGWQPGDIALEMGMGPCIGAHQIGNPTGFTALYPAFCNGSTRAAYRVLQTGDTSVVAPNSSHTLVVVYRGVAGIGNGGNGAFGNNDYASCALAAGNVSNASGSSWVACFGGEITGSTLSTNPSTGSPGYPGTLRSATLATDTHFYVTDSNGGVTSWAPPAWQTGFYNPFTGASYAEELLSK